MTQNILANIDPNTTSGTALANILNDWGNGVDSNQLGTNRPIGIQPGGFWVDTSGGQTNWLLKMATTLGDSTIMSVNVLTGGANFSGSIGGSYASSVPSGRQVQTTGSITGGGSLSGDLNLALSGDVDSTPGTLPPFHYYGTAAAGLPRQFHALPGYDATGAYVGGASQGGSSFSGGQYAVKRYLAAYPPGEYDFTVPANVSGIFLWIYAGGSTGGAGRGGAASGKLDVAPGSVIHLSVGGAGGQSNMAGAIVCPPGTNDNNGEASIPAGFDFTGSAPLLTNGVGASGNAGFIWLEYIGP